MNTRPSDHVRVLVVSDLHLFARRSIGAECFASVRPQHETADLLVLNGDIFDFRWSTLPDIAATVTASLHWLRTQCLAFPRTAVHYVLGNHDCPTFFRAGLADLTATLPNFHWHEHGVRIGSALFIHGDCTHRKMDSAGLSAYRKTWDNRRQYGAWRAKAYLGVDALGLTWATHKGWFPRRSTVGRLMHYLDRASPPWRETTRDCYFGHTHLPFSNHAQSGVTFHNTGSSIRGMGFNPIILSLPTAFAESLKGHEAPPAAAS